MSQSNSIVINGNKFEDINGRIYLNGKEVKHGVIEIRQPLKLAMLASFLVGAAVMAMLLNWVG